MTLVSGCMLEVKVWTIRHNKLRVNKLFPSCALVAFSLYILSNHNLTKFSFISHSPPHSPDHPCMYVLYVYTCFLLSHCSLLSFASTPGLPWKCLSLPESLSQCESNESRHCHLVRWACHQGRINPLMEWPGHSVCSDNLLASFFGCVMLLNLTNCINPRS